MGRLRTLTRARPWQGDVYHLLFDLGEWLDGRVWPRQDQLQVLRLLDLVHHVTGQPPAAAAAGMLPQGAAVCALSADRGACRAGQRLRAWFKNKGDPPHARWSDKVLRPVTRSGMSLHFLRRWQLRWAPPPPPVTAAARPV